MRASLERLLGRPVLFPVEITLSSGDKHFLPHPDHVQIHPHTGDLILYPDEKNAPFLVIVNPAQIVSVCQVKKAS